MFRESVIVVSRHCGSSAAGSAATSKQRQTRNIGTTLPTPGLAGTRNSFRLALTWSTGSRAHVVEPNQINILTLTVPGDLEQIDDTQKSRLSRQCWSDIRKTNRRNRVHFNLTSVHRIAGAHFNVGTHPYPDAAGEFSSTNC